MTTPVKLLFLCTGNSCRSIIAEALANHLGEGRIRAASAGSRPSGQVHPRALAVLERHGIPVGEPSSKSMDDLEGEHFDAIVMDPIATAKIEELIDELTESYTIAIVTHSMQQAARVSNRTAYFHLGRLIEVNDTETVFTKPEHELTEAYITGRFG